MNYRELLNEIIDKSGLSQKEICKKCEELGVKFSTNYLSIIKNTDDKIPSEEISKAIAKVCNAEHEDILLVQGYLDKAPKYIYNYIDKTVKIVLKSIAYTNVLNNEEITQEAFDNLIKNISLSYLVCLMNEELDNNINDNGTETKINIYDNLKIDADYILVPIDKNKKLKYLNEDEISNINL